MNIETDADGFLIDRSQWSEEVMHELALRSNLKLTDEHVKYILVARDMFNETGICPPIREFAKRFGMNRKAKPLYELFESGVMKRIAKFGGLVAPKGCI